MDPMGKDVQHFSFQEDMDLSPSWFNQNISANGWSIDCGFNPVEKHLLRIISSTAFPDKIDKHVWNHHQLMVNWWFGARWFGFRTDPLMKGIGNLGCTPRISNHQPKPTMITISWKHVRSKKRLSELQFWARHSCHLHGSNIFHLKLKNMSGHRKNLEPLGNKKTFTFHHPSGIEVDIRSTPPGPRMQSSQMKVYRDYLLKMK